MNLKSIFKKILFISAIGLASNSFSQSVSYNIKENNPDRRNLMIYLNPFNVQAYMPDINIGIDAQMNYLLNRRFQIDVDFRKAWTDAGIGIFAPKGVSKASQLQAGGCFNITNKLKAIRNKVILRSSTVGRYTLTSSIQVQADARRIFALRGGFQYFHNNQKGSSISAKDAQGNLYVVDDNITFETVSYAVRSYGLYAGLDFKTIRDLVISTTEYGTKKTKKLSNVYMDLLYTPGITYTLIPTYNQVTTFKNVDINIKENTRRTLGWRLGWQYVFNSTVGFNMKTEIGMMPGPQNVTPWFLTFGLGVNFGLKIKLFDKKASA
ncbi:MAG: hypothetical protein ABI388_02450 [Bacteroidia bacterium]